MNPFPLLLTLSLLGCYNPDLSGVHYTCDDKNTYCPNGLKCIDGYCGGSPSGRDAASGMDGAVRQDMSEAPDLALEAPGCKSGRGRVVNGKMNACPGTFNGGGEAAKLCADGWAWCTQNVAGAACEMQLPRNEFYVANTPQGQNANAPWMAFNVCTWNGINKNGSMRGLTGCGNGIGALDGPPNLTPCGGFQLTGRCWENNAPETMGPFSCPYMQDSDNDVMNIVNTEATRFGVLCCR